MIEYPVEGNPGAGYLAPARQGTGPGVLVLHAWWGLNEFFKSVCDRLAGEGFTALAPDLYAGAVANTVDEARGLLRSADYDVTKARVLGAADFLAAYPQVSGKGLGVMGFSMGGSWAIELSSLAPGVVRAAVVFYGTGSADFSRAQAGFLGHFAEVDEWEPLDEVRQMEAQMRAAGREVMLHTYPCAAHWFFETDRPEYDPQSAELAWQRSIEFLHQQLDQ